MLTKSFSRKEVHYLGHIVLDVGVKADPSKVQSMLDWPIPTTLKSLGGFLRLMGYYRKFIRSYGTIAAPLTTLLRKNAFGLTTATNEAFQNLKVAITEPQFLHYLIFLDHLS